MFELCWPRQSFVTSPIPPTHPGSVRNGKMASSEDVDGCLLAIGGLCTTWPKICVQWRTSAFLEYPDKQTCNSTTLHTHCTAKHNYRTAQHNYIRFLVIRVETHPFLLQLLPMLEKSGDPYGTMYNKKTSVSDPNIRSAGGEGAISKSVPATGSGIWRLRQKCAPAIDFVHGQLAG